LDGWRLRFRRTFGLAEAVEWENLYRVFNLCSFSLEEDEIKWFLEPSGGYSTSSMYMRLPHGAAVTHFKDVWRMKVPPQIRVFLWQLIRGRLPSCEQVAKWHDPLGWQMCLVWGDRRL
jgi:hypothetical protein